MTELQPDRKALASLFSFHCSSNTGYAIATNEKVFYSLGLSLAGGDSRLVHFAYRSLARGRSATLPDDFTNIVEFDPRGARREEITKLADYVRQHQIRVALFFDVQPVGPIFRPLRQAGVRTIVCYWGAPISSLMPWWKLTLKKLHIALSSSRADGVIFQSQAMAEYGIHGRGIPPSMVDVVPSGVDTEFFQPGKTYFVYQAMGLPRDRKVVIYAGHMEKRKGVRTLIEAAIDLLTKRKRTDVCFVLFGNKDDQSREFEQMYAGMGIDEYIRFGGYRPDLGKIYPGCYCGVIPSTGWDSMPRSVLEMAACGLPVIGSRLQGICESVLDQRTGVLFEPGNSRELADCLEKLLNNPQLAEQYGREARRRCERELTMEINKQRFLEVVRWRMG